MAEISRILFIVLIKHFLLLLKTMLPFRLSSRCCFIHQIKLVLEGGMRLGAIFILVLALAAAPWRSSEGAPAAPPVAIGAGIAAVVGGGVLAATAALGATALGATIAASLVGIGRRGTPKKRIVYQYVNGPNDVPSPYPPYPPYRGRYYHPFQGRYAPPYSNGGLYGHYQGPGYGENGHGPGYTSQQANPIREGPQSARNTYRGEKILAHV